MHSVTVPGAVKAWFDVWERFGSGQKCMRDLIGPAINLASEGFSVGPKTAKQASMN